jgi:L-2-hydroxyglutarate oxidase LhgO
VLDLFRRTISTVEIRGKGALHLTFDDGAELHVGPDARYESWHLTGIGVQAITVGPGGHTD